MRTPVRDDEGQAALEFIVVLALLGAVVAALVASPAGPRTREESTDLTCRFLTAPDRSNPSCGAERVLTPVSSGRPGPPSGSGGGATSNCAPTGMAIEQGLSPAALNVLRCSIAGFGDADISGRTGRTGAGDHPTGHAVDYMTYDDFAKGQEVAAWAVANAQALGIKYVIWYEQIWQPGRGWTPCSSGSCYTGPNDTLAHRDHVHISVY